jgi:hypothetical protein
MPVRLPAQFQMKGNTLGGLPFWERVLFFRGRAHLVENGMAVEHDVAQVVGDDVL